MTITDIVTNIDRRLVEVRAELTQLQDARTALAGVTRSAAARPAAAPRAVTPTAAPARSTAAPTPRRAPRTPAPAAYQVVPVGKLTALLAGSEGMRTRELSEATGGDPAQVLSLLKEQESAGEVRRSGTRASTRWHVITDEDRIAVRAAELASRSKRAARKN